MLPGRCRRAAVVRKAHGYVKGKPIMDSILLALCFLAMGVLVLAWAMLPHRAAAAEPAPEYRVAEAPAVDPALNIQAA